MWEKKCPQENIFLKFKPEFKKASEGRIGPFLNSQELNKLKREELPGMFFWKETRKIIGKSKNKTLINLTFLP